MARSAGVLQGQSLISESALQKVLQHYVCVHCCGCDEWQCEHIEGEDDELIQLIIEDALALSAGRKVIWQSR